MNVEGFEANVIQGVPALLAQPSLQAVLIELNGLGARYGFSDADLHARLLDFGFQPMRYEPFPRRLVALEGHQGQYALRSPVRGAGAAAAGSAGGAGVRCCRLSRLLWQ